MDWYVVIPSRYASHRLPGKPLADIVGRPMIVHVIERARETGIDPARIIVATDDQRIADAVTDAGGQVQMTADDHASGTDRVAEVAIVRGWADDAIVVNVQGDEPMLPAANILAGAEALERVSEADIATLACRIHDGLELLSPHAVKVVTDKAGFAHYFSRSPIPFDRKNADKAGLMLEAYPYLRHIGLYAYRVRTLKLLKDLPPAPTETLEGLEQLRALWNGLRIFVATVDEAPPAGIDTPADLARVQDIFQSRLEADA